MLTADTTLCHHSSFSWKMGTGGKVKHDGKKMAGYWNLAGIWRRESNDSRRSIFFLVVMWNDPATTYKYEIFAKSEMQ